MKMEAIAKQKILKINENWYIDSNDGNNNTLVNHYPAERKNKTTGEVENYTKKEEKYYPSIQSALQRYVQLCQEEATTVEECIKITQDAFEKIRSLRF